MYACSSGKHSLFLDTPTISDVVFLRLRHIPPIPELVFIQIREARDTLLIDYYFCRRC
jgi:hypothetical protein